MFCSFCTSLHKVGFFLIFEYSLEKLSRTVKTQQMLYFFNKSFYFYKLLKYGKNVLQKDPIKDFGYRKYWKFKEKSLSAIFVRELTAIWFQEYLGMDKRLFDISLSWYTFMGYFLELCMAETVWFIPHLFYQVLAVFLKIVFLVNIIFAISFFRNTLFVTLLDEILINRNFAAFVAASPGCSQSVASTYILPSQINLMFITYTKYKFINIKNCSNCGKVRWQG